VKVLVVGRSGQLARELLNTAPAAVEVISLAKTELDLANLAAIGDCIRRHAPAVVLNAAAYTAVDQAESERDLAYAINDTAVGALAEACKGQGAKLVHVSTDFVFDGKASRPYRIDDVPNPLNVYGASKLAGERRIAGISNLDWCIVRTAWVYSSAGRNFLTTMLRLFRERARVRVVADQIGTPTRARSLASYVWAVALSESRGLLHFTDAGVASWYDFAIAIYEEARSLMLIDKAVDIEPIATEQYPTPARRPSYSVLDKGESWQKLSVSPKHWRVELREVLQELTA
jgi:dTDP-4-dehydrorhamnose reductase